MSGDLPVLRQTVLDCRNPRLLAEFYRELLGWSYRTGDEAPAAGQPDPRGQDWLVLRPGVGSSDTSSGHGLAFSGNPDHRVPQWSPDPAAHGERAPAVPMQLHLDLTVSDLASLQRVAGRVVALGGEVAFDRTDDPQEPLYVFRDPAGHPFCVFVG